MLYIWKGPAKILSGMETSPYDDVCHIKTFYKCIHLIVIDTVVNFKKIDLHKRGIKPRETMNNLVLNIVSQLN